MLKVQEIREIVEMIENSSIQRFEFSQADTKLVIVKQERELPVVPSISTGEESREEMPVCSVSVPEPESKKKKQDDLYTVTSPMVGTFYAASDPESAPFVKSGQKVNEDTVVCIVEVMKLFNEVHAGVSGQIAEVLVKDGDFVEYGQPLFLVKKA
jgi:acetyl-CoA carboxylase biotin carboxyl carrier protein